MFVTTPLGAAGRWKPGLGALLACLIAVGIAAGARAPEGITAPDPQTCVGYPEPRVFLESQTWWSDDEVTADGAAQHAHSGVCVPLNGVVSGQVSFDVVSKLHNYEGWNLRFVRVQSATDQGGVDNVVITSPGTVCDTHDCTFVTRIVVNTDALATGRHEFRFHSEARPGVSGGPKSLATNGWQVCIRSCAGVTPQATENPEARGWYETEAGSVKGYVNARFDSQTEFPWQADRGFVPVSGRWCPPVRILRGAGDESAERSRVVVDPNFHAGNPGLTVLDQAGPFQGRACVDTTQLADGIHKLVLIAYSSTQFDGQLWGVFVVPFLVSNGGTPPPPPSDPPPSDPPPSAALTSPSAGASVTGMTSLDVSASADTMRVAYLVDGIQVAEDATTGEFAANWNSSSVANGSHVAVARAFDLAGNTADSAAVSFTVENAVTGAAVVALKNPTAGATVSGRIRLDVTTASGVTRVEYFVDGVRVAYDKTAPDFSEDWVSSTVANGSHVLVARALDAANVWHDSASVQITISN